MDSKMHRAAEIEARGETGQAARLSAGAAALAPHIQWFNEPAAVLAGYVVLVLLIRFAGATLWRAWLAGALALLGSGFSLAAVLYPRRNTLDTAERLALSGLLSLAVGGIAGFILVQSPWGLTLTSSLLSAVLFNAACYVAVIYRRRNLAAFEQPALLSWRPATTLPAWFGRQPRGGLILAAALVVLLMAGVGALYQAARTPVADPGMTEFFLLDGNGQVEDFPTSVAPDQRLNLAFGVNNREQTRAEYQVLALVSGQLVGDSGAFALAPGQQRRAPLAVTVPGQARGNTRIDFILFRDGKRDRDLYLWLTVSQAGK